MLSSLPCRFGDLRNLRYLNLSSCRNLNNLPVSFRNLSLLQHLNLWVCRKLILELDEFQNVTKLEFLSFDGCRQLEGLRRHITNQASLRELHLKGVKRLREVPIEIGELGRLQELGIGSKQLISLPNSLGHLSLLTHLRIVGCPKLESLPTSLGDLSSLTRLTIQSCPKITRLPFSVGCLSLLQYLHIYECPIIQVDFDVASSSSTISSNLRCVKIERTEVCRISICKDRYPGLERLELFDSDQLTEVEAVPVSLECLRIRGSPKLVMLPRFARLTSLRELQVRGCEKMEGLEHYTGLEK